MSNEDTCHSQIKPKPIAGNRGGRAGRPLSGLKAARKRKYNLCQTLRITAGFWRPAGSVNDE
jgi:hypothetical protein